MRQTTVLDTDPHLATGRRKPSPEVGEERRKHLGHVGQDAVDAHPNQGVELLARERARRRTEHTSPYDALVLVLEGEFVLVIGGVEYRAPQGTIVRLPANVPHAPVRSRMLLMMVK
ncbi:MAG TPA: cupin domain-containing protein [Vicinamibacterales bacterium]|nr:cupin domain-containing protein [Acidobacteriota bacterium]HQX80413.1 cupin domain-containing protein [Vicinamibacterales bacterium]